MTCSGCDDSDEAHICEYCGEEGCETCGDPESCRCSWMSTNLEEPFLTISGDDEEIKRAGSECSRSMCCCQCHHAEYKARGVRVYRIQICCHHETLFSHNLKIEISWGSWCGSTTDKFLARLSSLPLKHLELLFKAIWPHPPLTTHIRYMYRLTKIKGLQSFILRSGSKDWSENFEQEWEERMRTKLIQGHVSEIKPPDKLHSPRLVAVVDQVT